MEDFLAACAELRPKVLAETGCLAYDHTIPIHWPPHPAQANAANRVVLIEAWDGEESLRRHGTVPHGKDFAARVRPLRESVRVEVLRRGALSGQITGTAASSE